MLLPDNIQPEYSLYYNGAIILSELKKEQKQSILDLYRNVKKVNNMSYLLFIISLDWLYLIDAAEMDVKGSIILCI